MATGVLTVPPEESQRAGGNPSPDAEVRLRVHETLAAAARGADDDPRRVPGALCEACARLLPITGSSVSISGGNGVRITWCASDRVAARLAELQYTVGDGPCQTALEQDAPVIAADLTGGFDARRWPIFAHEAVGLGVRAVFSLPLGVSGAVIGTLDLYSECAGGLGEQDLRTALWVRDAVTYALMNLQAAAPAYSEEDPEGEVAAWVAASEADHTEVYQAVGMVMVQLDVDPEQALDRLRGRAYADGRTVSQLAREVLARKTRFRPESESEDGSGVLGIDGIDGIDGSDGSDGIDGRDGVDGSDGRDGIAAPRDRSSVLSVFLAALRDAVCGVHARGHGRRAADGRRRAHAPAGAPLRLLRRLRTFLRGDRRHHRRGLRSRRRR